MVQLAGGLGIAIGVLDLLHMLDQQPDRLLKILVGELVLALGCGAQLRLPPSVRSGQSSGFYPAQARLSSISRSDGWSRYVSISSTNAAADPPSSASGTST